MADSNYDEIEILYNEVLALLERGERMDSIDSDSLVDVYDYAFDQSDEYVASEVMAGLLAREPDNADMLERKAIRLLQLGEYQGVRNVLRRMPEDSFVSRLVEVQMGWDKSRWREGYEKLFAGFRKGTVEGYGAISVIDLAIGVDSLHNLVVMMPVVLPYFRYPADFLADLSNTLYDNSLHEDAALVLQELTTLEPFCVDHWVRLAEIYLNRLKDPKECMNALDYALAIDPDSSRALLMLGDLLIKTDSQIDKVLEISERLINLGEYRSDALYLKAGALISLERNDEAFACMEEYLADCVNPLDAFILLLSLRDGVLPQNLDTQLVELLRGLESADVSDWFERARSYVSPTVVAAMADAVRRSGVAVDEELFSLILLCDYRSGRFGDVIEAYEARFPQKNELSAGLIYLFAQLKKEGLSAKAVETMKRFNGIVHSKDCLTDVNALFVSFSAQKLLSELMSLIVDGFSADKLHEIDIFS
ncbi:MAG: hypothetical protein K2L85_03830 [Paramuribaculum sp.]|nr:hypothetical protein [Paramuribaculum sp.]